MSSGTYSLSIKQKILRHCIEHTEKRWSIYEIAEALSTDYKLVHTNIQKLIHDGGIDVEDRGNAKLCSFSGTFSSDVFIVETQRRNDLLKNKNFLLIYNRLQNISKQFILLLFGSYVKGTATKHSDIDVLVISDEEAAQEVEREIRLLPHNIHLTAITYEEFRSMLRSKEFTVGSEAVKKNIILFGVEDYYRLLDNAR